MDSWALSSYRRAADAWQRGAFDLEVAPVRVKNPRAAMLGSLVDGGGRMVVDGFGGDGWMLVDGDGWMLMTCGIL